MLLKLHFKIKNLFTEGIKNIPISANFFKSYRETTITPNEILRNITFPTTKDVPQIVKLKCNSNCSIKFFLNSFQNEFVWCAKQARRKEDDISIVTTCMRIQLDSNSLLVKNAVLVFGGMAPVTAMAKKATSFLIGR
jgi:xanthine dehydrogenase/oxidase